jgi:hypothetical protein
MIAGVHASPRNLIFEVSLKQPHRNPNDAKVCLFRRILNLGGFLLPVPVGTPSVQRQSVDN